MTSILIRERILKVGRPTTGRKPQQRSSVSIRPQKVPEASACVDRAEIEQIALSKVGDGLAGQGIVADVRHSAENERAILDPTGQDIDPGATDDRIFFAATVDGAVTCQTARNAILALPIMTLS